MPNEGDPPKGLNQQQVDFLIETLGIVPGPKFFETHPDIAEAIGAKAAPEDGDDDPEATAKPAEDSLRDKWLKAATAMKPRVAAAIKKADENQGQIRASWIYATEQAHLDADKGYRAALASLGNLDALVAAALAADETEGEHEAAWSETTDGEKQQVRWAAVERQLKPRLEAVRSRSEMEADDIRRLWQFATEKAADKGFGSAFKAVEKLLPLLTALEKKGDPGKVDAEGHDAETRAHAQEQETARSADAALREGAKTAIARIAEVEAAIKAFGAAHPGDWGTQLSAFKLIALPDEDAAPSEFEEVITKLEKPVGSLLAAIADLTDSRTEWLKDTKIYEARLGVLTAHPAAGANPPVAPKIAEITADFAAAKAKADGFKYVEAALDLPDLINRCGEVRDFADDYQHYKAILGDREQSLTELPAIVDALPVKYDQVKDAIQELLDLVTEAKKLAQKTPPEFPAAIAELDKIPPLQKAAKRLVHVAKKYDNKYAGYVARVATLKGNATPEVQALISARLGRLDQRLTAADIATTGDFNVSDNLLDACIGMLPVLENAAIAVENYLSWKVWFDPEVEKIRVHPGRRGIEPFYQKLTKDKASTEAKAGLDQFVAANKILSAYDDPDFISQTAIADQCVASEAEEGKLDTRIKAIEARDNSGLLVAGIGNLKSLFAEAKTASAKRDFDLADDLIARANDLAQTLEDQLDADHDLAELGKQMPLDDLANEFAAAKAKAEEMLAFVEGKRSGTDFQELLDFAQTHIDVAQKDFDSGSGDFAGLKGIFENVISGLKDILQKIAQKERYDAALQAVSTLHKTTLPTEQIEDCLKDDLKDIGDLITEAKDSAKEPHLDFAAANDTLARARKLAERALVKAQLYKQRKPDLDEAKLILPDLKDNARKDVFKDDIVRIEAQLKAIDDDWTAGRYEESCKKAAQAKGWRAPYQDHVAAFDNAMAVYDAQVVNYRPGWDVSLDDWGQGDVVKIEKATADAYIAQIHEALKAKAFQSAVNHCYNVSDLVKMAVKVLDRKTAYEAALATANTHIKAVSDKTNKGVEQGLADLAAKIKQAGDFAADRRFPRATELLKTLPKIADDLGPVADSYAALEPVMEKAAQAVSALKGADQVELVAPRLEQVDRKVDLAETALAARDFDTAKAKYEDVLATCAEAATALAQRIQLETAARAGASDSTNKDALVAALEQVTAALDQIQAKPGANFAVGPVTQARDALKTAKAKLEADDLTAGADITTAAGLCATAETAIAQFGFLSESCEDTQAEIADLLKEAETIAAGYMNADLARLATELTDARSTALSSGELKPALAALDAARRELSQLAALLVDHKEFLKTYKERSDEVDALEAHKCRFAIAKEMKNLRTALRRASSHAQARDHAAAMTLLQSVALDETTAKITADMQANEDIDPKDLAAIIARDDGDKQLDAIVEKLDPRTQRKVMNAAMEARFGVTFKMFETVAGEQADARNAGDGKRAPNLRRIYELMSDLPKEDTLDNDNLEVMIVNLGTVGSDFDFRTKVMGVREGKDFEAYTRPLSTEHELGDVIEDAQALPGDPMTMLSWNTLHEVGHAVDDKKSIMIGNLEKASHGDWKEFGGNVAPVATDFAGAHKYDRDYAAAYLSGNASPPVPPCPENVDEVEWEQRRISMRTQIDAARADPWDSQAASKACTLRVDGTDYVYQESYPTWWTRYPLAERSKGVTGYQFRAPGEWFSELYAAFKSNRLKKSHPYYDLMAKV